VTADIRIIDGLTIKLIPKDMFKDRDEQVRSVTLTALAHIQDRGLRVEEVVRIFRGNAFVGVSRKNLDGLVASWVDVWKRHGRF
jgi:hypothetical protein